jgi:hypothetical protein
MADREYRDGLPPMSDRIAALPVDRGYPVPWFVVWHHEDGQPTYPKHTQRVGSYLEGAKPDFRMTKPNAVAIAVRENRCWVCGQRLGRFKTFPIGPMCVVNKVTAEPPSHRDCAEWSAMACPWLTRPHAKRRPVEEGKAGEAPGLMLGRNPGVTALWTTESFKLTKVPNGVLMSLGEPVDVDWMREGRTATRDEVLEAIESGIPILHEACELDADPADSHAMLDRCIAEAILLVPSA